MRKDNITSFISLAMLIPIMFFLGLNDARAHCDTMDGPVVKAAKKALETGNINLVLIWVQKKDEAEIRKAFEQTLTVRKLNEHAKELADMYFFETLVRVHRAGEGAPYTGLKPAGAETEPGIELADMAIEKGSGEELVKKLNETMHNSLHQLFSEVKAKKNFDVNNVEAGREYVKTYVTFIHFVERLHQAAQQPLGEHAHEAHESGKEKH